MGRDKESFAGLIRHICFNPRARMGRDCPLRSPWPGEDRFNPRARMGRDTLRLYTTLRSVCFNPRARMGRDPSEHLLRGGVVVSIHAPVWGATYNHVPHKRI